MTSVRIAIGLLMAGDLVFACSQGESQRNPQLKAVAAVNGEPIILPDLQKELDSMKGADREFDVNGKRAKRIRRDLLERMIDTKLLLQEAKKKRIVLEPKLIDATIEMIAKEYPPGGLTEELLKQGKTLEAYQAETRNTLLLDKLLKREVVDRIAVPREEIESYYRQHHRELKRPEEVRVRQIVTKTEEDAKKLRREILRGASFEELARKHSLGPEAAKGGDLGYFPRGRMPPAIEEACFKLWSSRVSQVVVSPYGFHLFMLVNRRPVRELTLQEAWQEIERRLIAKKIAEAEEDYIRSLRDKASIERDLSLLDLLH